MTPIALPITSLTALFSGLLILALTLRVVQLRRRGGVVLGDNDDRMLVKAIRGHANAVEQLPIALILMGLAELQGGPLGLLVLGALILVMGRALHGLYFAVHGTNWRFRVVGMWMTLLAQVVLIAALAITLIG
ncbi:MAPEG family protein [Loktanella sp. Alg231-35]|uniref:MAPEG family protein n=1 Tax=Loktanella sp. Alg231-35 TaxID=1922220 RepID=UPI000D55935D|nr:MAPEG family protein [Loktanella sp. Alg231-35]